MPTTIAELIAWAGSHSDLWTLHQAQIGLSSAQVAAYKSLSDTLAQDAADADAARQASKSATLKLNDSVTAVRALSGAYVNTIKAFAQTSHNNNVYVLAGVFPDSPPSPVPAPVPPESLSAALQGNGALVLTWKVAQPAGVSNVQYRVMRKLDTEDTFTLIGTAGSKKTFTDKTIPFGTDSLAYQIEPWRGEVMGDVSGQFGFQFGIGGPGLTITAVTPGKMAA